MKHPDISKPLITAGWLRALLFFIVILLMGISFIIGTNISSFKNQSAKDFPGTLLPVHDPTGLQTLIIFILVFSVTYVFRRWIDRKSFASLGFRTDGFLSNALAGGMLGISVIGVSCLILQGTGHLKWMDIIFDSKAVFLAFGAILLVAVSEELVFRGYILNNLMDTFPNWIALLISSGLFMLFHWSSAGFFPLINTLVLGMVLGLNYVYTRNLWFSICFHIGWKFLEGPLLGLSGSEYSQTVLQSDIHGDETITGGAYGLEGSAILLMVSLLSLLVMYLFLQKKLNQRSQPVPGQI